MKTVKLICSFIGRFYRIGGKKFLIKGSFTVEGAIVVPLFLLVFVIAINMGIDFYSEIKSDTNAFASDDLWEVSDFYKYEMIEEAVND